MQDPPLTVAEAAAQLRVNPVTIRRWLVAGTLRGHRLPSRRSGWRIPRAEVERLSETPDWKEA